jgi:hypothetical protein
VKKAFGYFLSLTILVVTLIPCADAEPITGDQDMAVIQWASDCQDDVHVDNCSPFCTCTCCPGLSLLHKSVTETIVISLEGNYYHAEIPGRLHYFALPVWQPPQLV